MLIQFRKFHDVNVEKAIQDALRVHWNKKGEHWQKTSGDGFNKIGRRRIASQVSKQWIKLFVLIECEENKRKRMKKVDFRRAYSNLGNFSEESLKI